LKEIAMKLIVAFIRPSHAEPVVRALEQAGLYHLSLSRVHGVVQPDAPVVRADMGAEGELEVRLEAYCEDARFEQAVELIRETGHIGSLPSGALFVHPVDHAWIVSQAVTGEW
jgi:nitrogen regulatory protein PII